jgi:hypothetical protein
MTKSRKVWVKPELIILVRSKPEEAVLGSCKATTGGSDFGVTNSGCYFTLAICLQCDVFASS